MSSIATSPGIVTGPIEIGAARRIGAAVHGNSALLPAAVSDAVNPAPAPLSPPVPAVMAALAGGSPPVDQGRVALIKQAIATGSYPVVPTKIADAMIAAGLMLRISK